MSVTVRQLLLALALLCWAGLSAAAAPSGLSVMPTADLVEPHRANLEYQANGLRLFDSSCDQWALLQVGLSDRLEAGLDRCFDGDPSTYANAKFLLVREGSRYPALAIGLQGWGEGESGEPYLVASRSAGHLRLHLGAVRRLGEVDGMVGAELLPGGRFSLVLDQLTSSDGVTALGLGVALAGDSSLLLSRIVGNSVEVSDAWQLIVTFSLPPGSTG